MAERSPRLTALHEFGKLAAKLHAAKCVGALDLSNCLFEPDGTGIRMISVGRARVLDDPPTIQERGSDLASVKATLDASDWQAVMDGYRLQAGADAEEVLACATPTA